MTDPRGWWRGHASRRFVLTIEGAVMVSILIAALVMRVFL